MWEKTEDEKIERTEVERMRRWEDRIGKLVSS
jgi:hypothetical protein